MMFVIFHIILNIKINSSLKEIEHTRNGENVKGKRRNAKMYGKIHAHIDSLPDGFFRGGRHQKLQL